MALQGDINDFRLNKMKKRFYFVLEHGSGCVTVYIRLHKEKLKLIICRYVKLKKLHK